MWTTIYNFVVKKNNLKKEFNTLLLVLNLSTNLTLMFLVISYFMEKFDWGGLILGFVIMITIIWYNFKIFGLTLFELIQDEDKIITIEKIKKNN